MSTLEMVIERARGLTDQEAQAVLAYMARLPSPRRWTAQELLLPPKEERDRILESQMTKAARLYRDDPSLMVDGTDAPMEYE